VRSRDVADDGRNEEGFTLIELTVAMALLAMVMLGFAGAVYGGMGAWAASRQRSAFVEIANAEMETLRALPYDVVGVNTSTDTDWSTAYPSGQRDGRDYVDVTAVDTSNKAPESVTSVSGATVRGIVVPYTVRRWVTWTDLAGGSTHKIKRLELRVEWSESNEASRSLTLTSVLYPGGKGSAGVNNDPTANFTVSPGTSVSAGASVSFDASTSSDPDGDALTYAWNFGDGTTVSAGAIATTTHTFAAAGTYTVVLTITDARSGTGTKSTTMTVAAATNSAPVASFTHTPVLGTAPLSVSVNATGSSDPDGNPLTYSWNWGDSTAAGSGVNATHVFASAGTYIITLTVSDTSNATATAQGIVVVLPLNCDVYSGSFKNPSSNGTSNDIDVASNNKPENNSFTFYATSNTACTSISGRLPYAGGTWSVTLSQTDTENGVVSWQGTANFNSSDRFNTGNLQTGEFWSPGSTGTSDKFSFTFNVHT
jgi:prepilin-type N-terminal cleavage/methylation domain-containing protein